MTTVAPKETTEATDKSLEATNRVEEKHSDKNEDHFTTNESASVNADSDAEANSPKSRKDEELQHEVDLLEQALDVIPAKEQICAAYSRDELLDIFTEALTKLDDRKNLSRFCPVCNRRKLPKVDSENVWTEELGKHFELASTLDQNDITAVNKVDDITFNNDAINSLLTKWLNSKLADKPYSDFGDEISFGFPNDGFSRLFSKVAMDHRMNIIRGVCGGVCVEFDLETGMTDAFSRDKDKYRFTWRETFVRGSKPIVITDEKVKEKMVVALCRAMKTDRQ
ncbi:uncharacterized protein LOC134855444 [Symsagittifera roscoffensis]|uniref:uncharacterized protein LOC134855444 n=1 Tax=Symsagittifera roscoffensis TaxID=84072 RepID=UPI00307BBB63